MYQPGNSRQSYEDRQMHGDRDDSMDSFGNLENNSQPRDDRKPLKNYKKHQGQDDGFNNRGNKNYNNKYRDDQNQNHRKHQHQNNNNRKYTRDRDNRDNNRDQYYDNSSRSSNGQYDNKRQFDDIPRTIDLSRNRDTRFDNRSDISNRHEVDRNQQFQHSQSQQFLPHQGMDVQQPPIQQIKQPLPAQQMQHLQPIKLGTPTAQVFYNSSQSNNQQVQQYESQGNRNQSGISVNNGAITVSITRNNSNKKDQLNALLDIIDLVFSYTDIEMKFTNCDSGTTKQLKMLQEKYQRLQLNITNIDEDSTIVEPISQIVEVQQQIIQPAEPNIYDFKQQLENQVSCEMRMILMHWKLIQQFTEKAVLLNIIIQVNSSDCQYKIDGQNQDLVVSFFREFQQQLDRTVVLLYPCKSTVEAKSIAAILSTQQSQTELGKHLQCSNVQIDSISNLRPENFANAKSLIDPALYLSKQPTVFALCENGTDQKIDKLQSRYQIFVNDPKQVKKLKQKQLIEVTTQPDMQKARKELQKHLQTGLEIIMAEPNFNNQRKNYTIEIEYTMWIAGQVSDQDGNAKINQIKEKVYKIFNPLQLIPLTDTKQLALWKEYLSNRYEKPINNCHVKTIKNNQNDQYLIQIIGDEQDTQVVKKQIETELHKYNRAHIQCTYHDKHILRNLQNQDLQRIYSCQIAQLAANFTNIMELKIQAVDKNVDQINFVVIHETKGDNIDQIKSHIQKQFVSKLTSEKLQADFRKFLAYIDKDDSEFEDEYSVVVTTNQNSKTFLTGLPESLLEIKQLCRLYQKSLEEQFKTVKIGPKSLLIMNRWNKLVVEHKFKLPDNVRHTIAQEHISLNGPSEEVDQVEQEIINTLQSWEQLIIKKPLALRDKEVDYFLKKLQAEQKQLETQYECLITTNKQRVVQEQKSAATLSINNKTMNIVLADISKFKCDAIVNSCNDQMSFGDPNMLTGVAQKIFQMGGLPYQKFCEEYISKVGRLEPGKAIIYPLPNNQYVKYIINVSTPIYSSGAQIKNDMETIKKSLKAIHTIAANNKVKTLAIPILGGGSAGYNFNSVATVIMNTLIDLHFESIGLPQQISIVEFNETKIKSAQQIIQLILTPQQKPRSIKYIWQWQDTDGFKPYDDPEINKQIDEAFEAYTLNPLLNEVKLAFPFSKQPGTHLVNLANNTVTDISLKTVQQLTIQALNGNFQFYLDAKPLDKTLSEYLMIQKTNRNNSFQIFYKRHKIVFAPNSIAQLNEETGYSRPVKATINNNANLQQQPKQNILVNQKFQLQINDKYNTGQQINQNDEQIIVEMFEINNFNNVVSRINNYIKSMTTTINVQLPNLRDDDFIQLEEYLKNGSIAINGQFTQGGSITLEIFKTKEKKILDYINFQIKDKQHYPVEWIKQTQNSVKSELYINSPEYQAVLKDFKLTYSTGQIFKIYRIQNKLLYENYVQEKKKLLDNGNAYTAIEQERMLWHGVRGAHPKIIYEGLKEAFDVTYSAQGMWGDGIYFAERAEYSKGYSYTLTAQDDALMVGKKVFLCCKVTTGRVHVCASDQNLRRPPIGFDSVGGFTNGSNVFILYSMDVRRAYPAYEVIYQ